MTRVDIQPEFETCIPYRSYNICVLVTNTRLFPQMFTAAYHIDRVLTKRTKRGQTIEFAAAEDAADAGMRAARSLINIWLR